jgi:hypothetical protein
MTRVLPDLLETLDHFIRGLHHRPFPMVSGEMGDASLGDLRKPDGETIFYDLLFDFSYQTLPA